MVIFIGNRKSILRYLICKRKKIAISIGYSKGKIFDCEREKIPIFIGNSKGKIIDCEREKFAISIANAKRVSEDDSSMGWGQKGDGVVEVSIFEQFHVYLRYKRA